MTGSVGDSVGVTHGDTTTATWPFQTDDEGRLVKSEGQCCYYLRQGGYVIPGRLFDLPDGLFVSRITAAKVTCGFGWNFQRMLSLTWRNLKMIRFWW